ncbi:uncharacterized protein L201_002538 [Kwoniella dendrophila CBS 6074]|uniref:Uncharacterized protein n=1 Tax=Kwoniella dendrophila CBS 6074 TaxID=1295534 RepID=A0AAX4JRX7_9TREE
MSLRYTSDNTKDELKKYPELFIKNNSFYIKVKPWHEGDVEACRLIMNPQNGGDELCGENNVTTASHELMCISHLALLENEPTRVTKV